MTRRRSIEQSLFRLSFVLFLALAARFGWVVARHAWNRAPEPVSTTSVAQKSPLAQLAELQRQMGVPPQASSSVDSLIAQAMGSAHAAAAPSSSASAPPTIKSYLSVQVGPARSEMRVDGLVVGRTPYVGQITCQRGRSVRIDLLPQKGMPKTYEIPCVDGEMRLLDEP